VSGTVQLPARIIGEPTNYGLPLKIVIKLVYYMCLFIFLEVCMGIEMAGIQRNFGVLGMDHMAFFGICPEPDFAGY